MDILSDNLVISRKTSHLSSRTEYTVVVKIWLDLSKEWDKNPLTQHTAHKCNLLVDLASLPEEIATILSRDIHCYYAINSIGRGPFN